MIEGIITLFCVPIMLWTVPDYPQRGEYPGQRTGVVSLEPMQMAWLLKEYRQTTPTFIMRWRGSRFKHRQLLHWLLVIFTNLSTAKWLDQDDKQYIEERIKVRGGGYTKAHATKKEVLTTMFHPRMVAHYFAYLCDMIPLGSMVGAPSA